MLRRLTCERAERWVGASVLLALLVLGPSTVGAVVAGPTAWDWVRLVAWVFAVLGFGLTTVSAWRNRNTSPVAVVRVSPAEIPVEDVRAAIAATSDRIPAIKRLREVHPGLGLRDAKELVERHLPGDQ